MDFRTSAILFWSGLAFVQLAPALYLFFKRKHLLFAISFFGIFSLLTWQKILWVFWADYYIDREYWILGLKILWLCTLYVGVGYFWLHRLTIRDAPPTLKPFESRSLLAELVLFLTILPEFFPTYRFTVFYLPCACIQTLALARVLLVRRMNWGAFFAIGFAALCTFVAIQSLAFGMRFLEVSLIIGIVRPKVRYWVGLIASILVVSLLQTVKPVFRVYVSYLSPQSLPETAEVFLKSVKDSQTWLFPKEISRNIPKNDFVTYYGYGAGKIDPYYFDHSLLPWEIRRWNDLHLALSAYFAPKNSQWNLIDKNSQPSAYLSSRLAGSTNLSLLFPIFQFAKEPGRELAYFPESELFGLSVFPVQEWDYKIFAFTRGLLRLGDDTFDRVLKFTPRKVPYLRGESYKQMLTPETSRPFENGFGKKYGYLSQWDDKTTVSFNQFTEGYSNFGYRGALIVALLFGALLYLSQSMINRLSPGIREISFVALAKVFFFPKAGTVLLVALGCTAYAILILELLKHTSFLKQHPWFRRKDITT